MAGLQVFLTLQIAPLQVKGGGQGAPISLHLSLTLSPQTCPGIQYSLPNKRLVYNQTLRPAQLPDVLTQCRYTNPPNASIFLRAEIPGCQMSS